MCHGSGAAVAPGQFRASPRLPFRRLSRRRSRRGRSRAQYNGSLGGSHTFQLGADPVYHGEGEAARTLGAEDNVVGPVGAAPAHVAFDACGLVAGTRRVIGEIGKERVELLGPLDIFGIVGA